MDDRLSEAVQREISELLKSGRKIEAIKLYRETTGLGLKEAKDVVEAVESGGSGDSGSAARPSVHRDPFAQKKGGCFGVFLLLTLAFFALAAALR